MSAFRAVTDPKLPTCVKILTFGCTSVELNCGISEGEGSDIFLRLGKKIARAPGASSP